MNLESRNCVYMLLCNDNTLYTGWTNNIIKRLQAHNSGSGAKYTKPRLPVRLVYLEYLSSKNEAMRREWEIKQMSRSKKLALIKETKLPIEVCTAVKSL